MGVAPHTCLGNPTTPCVPPEHLLSLRSPLYYSTAPAVPAETEVVGRGTVRSVVGVGAPHGSNFVIQLAS